MRYAVLFGVSEYAGVGADIPKLPDELQALADVLRREMPIEYRFTPVYVQLNPDARKTSIEEHLDSLAKPGAFNTGTVLILLSGHGVQRRKHTYFMTYGCSPAEPGVRLSDLEGMLHQVKAQTLLVVLDFCHSGGVLQEYEVAQHLTLRRVPQIAVLAACRADEEAPLGREHKSLTEVFCEGLTAAEPDETGTITWSSLTAYVQKQYRSFPGRPQEFRSDISISELPLNVVARKHDERDPSDTEWELITDIRKGRISIIKLREMLLDMDIEEAS